MRAHPEKRLLYLPHPRTASTSTEAWMDDHGWTDPAPSLDKHAPLSVLKKHTGQDFSGWSVATTVRNHFDALVSWSFVELAHMDFGPEWLERFVEACEYVEPGRLYPLHLEDADTVLRYEHLESGLSGWVGRTVALPTLHESEGRAGRGWREFYTPEMREAVERQFGDEMERIGYPMAA